MSKYNYNVDSSVKPGDLVVKNGRWFVRYTSGDHVAGVYIGDGKINFLVTGSSIYIGRPVDNPVDNLTREIPTFYPEHL